MTNGNCNQSVALDLIVDHEWRARDDIAVTLSAREKPPEIRLPSEDMPQRVIDLQERVGGDTLTKSLNAFTEMMVELRLEPMGEDDLQALGKL